MTISKIAVAKNWISSSEAARRLQVHRSVWDYYLQHDLVPKPTHVLGKRRFYTEVEYQAMADMFKGVTT